jgi:secreted trypsin-like serine protease
MNRRPTASVRPLAARPLAPAALTACVCVAACLLVVVPAGAFSVDALHDNTLLPQIINGPATPISSDPWQVFVLEVDEEGEGICGGSILNETHILTAGHCVVDDNTQKAYPASDFAVVAGATKIGGFFEGLGFADIGWEPESGEGVLVSLIRVHPYRNIEVGVDDVAVLTLAKPLKLSAANHMQTIQLASASAGPASGTALNVSGYGKQEGDEQNKSITSLHSTTLTALSNDACRGAFINDAQDSPISICASSPTSATCQGDSGGPITEGNPAVQVGLVDYGPNECPPGKPDVFVNVAAPEIRDFIEGSESPPTASRSIAPPAIKSVGPAPVDFGPLTCEAGGWSTPPSSLTYTFQAENVAATVLQSGTSNVFTAPASLLGTPVVCIVQAASPGGIATARSATTPAVAADTSPPTASITGLSCAHAQACTLTLAASDPNGAALTVTATVAYKVTAKCRAKRRKKKGKHAVCNRTHTATLPVSSPSPGAYTAVAGELPLGETIVFTASVTNAAGLHPTTPLTRSTTLRKPKKKKKMKR